VTVFRASIVVALLAVATYANSLSNGFAYDDNLILPRNPATVSGDWRSAAASPYQPDALTGAGLYRPLTSASFALEWLAFEGRPVGFHLSNVVVHASVSLMVLWLLLGWAPLVPAFLGAALFAVHPVHVEAVANVVGRGELYCAFFFLFAVVLYWRGGGWTGWKRGARLLGIAFSYGLSLSSKEMGVTLPGVLLLLELARPWFEDSQREEGQGSKEVEDRTRSGGRSFWGRLWAEAPTYTLLLVVLSAYLIARWMVLGTLKGEAVDPVFRLLTPGQRVLTSVSLWPQYLRLLLFPLDLVADYAPGVLFPAEGVTLEVGLGVLALAGLIALAARAFRVSPAMPLLGTGIFWFLLTLLPVSNLLFPTGVVLAERTLYLPSVGLAMAAASVAARFGPIWRGRIQWSGLAVVLALGGLMARSVLRNPTWRSTYTVLQTLNREHPESHLAFLNRGVGLEELGEFDKAGPEFAMAVRLAPERYGTLTAAAGFLGAEGSWGEAEALLRRAQTIAPDRDDAYRLLAAQLLRQGRGREAHREALKGLARAGFHPDLWAAVSESYVLKGDLEAAVRARQAAVAADPRSAPQLRRLAELLDALGRGGEATVARSAALALEHEDAGESHSGTGSGRETLHSGELNEAGGDGS